MKASLTREQISNIITPIIAQYDIHRAYFFGSYARDEQSVKSDIDILLEVPDNSIANSLEFYTLWDLLESSTGLSIDLLTEAAVQTCPDKRFINAVNRDRWCFYDARRAH